MSTTDVAEDGPATAVATRTLIAAGFTITNSQRHPAHIEYQCERFDVFSAVVQYLVAIFETDTPNPEELESVAHAATDTRRILVTVAKLPGRDWISWEEFLDGLGGAVPTWRALGENYSEALEQSARNAVGRAHPRRGGDAVFENQAGTAGNIRSVRPVESTTAP